LILPGRTFCLIILPSIDHDLALLHSTYADSPYNNLPPYIQARDFSRLNLSVLEDSVEE
jgi:hypothetical protein